MPLISNDERWEFLENSVDFDRSEYAIVRKLFLQFKEHVKSIDEQWIRETFEKFGDIESIEVFTEENAKIWAYLTFSKDEEAYRALNGGASELNEIDEILTADSWHQPTTFTEPELVAGNLVETFDFQLTDANGTAVSLRKCRKILRNIGPCITDLGIFFRMDKYPKNVHRYFYKICQYAGPNVKTLRLKYFPSNQDWLQQLKPLLGRIECLNVLSSANYDFMYDIDFQFYCPNVKTLKLKMNLNGTLLSKAQPKLERLSMLHNQFMEEKLVLEFMKNNPQLKYLKIEANDCDNLLKQIPLYLEQLEKLCLYQGYPNITAENLEHLASTKQLTKLKLMFLDEEDFNGILNCLPKFRQLVELKLHLSYDGVDCVDLDEIFSPNRDLLTALAEELPLLECFHIQFCDISAETLIDFIRRAKKLKTVKVYRCGLEVSDLILETIDNVRKAESLGSMVLCADKISSELNKEKPYSNVSLHCL